MARAHNTTADPALDAAALLRRIGFFGLFVVLPVLAQVARRAAVILGPIAVILLVIASAIDGRQRPVRPGLAALVRSPAFLAGLLVLAWSALSVAWTPFPSQAVERLLNVLATVGLTVLAYFALPARMRSANLYLLPLGMTAAAIVAILLGLFGDTLLQGAPDDDNALDRGLVLLALLVWPAVAWLRSRRRDIEALAVAVLVAVALVVSPSSTQVLALAMGAFAFAATTLSPAWGVRLTAAFTAGILALAPILPFIGRPILAAVLGPVAPSVLSLKAWQKVVTTEPVRLVTGHGFETALRGRLVGLVPTNAPTTAFFEFWYELGIVGAFAAAFALYTSIRYAGRTAPVLVPGVVAAFATAYTVAGIGVGLTVMWWLTSLAITVLVFVAIARGQFRTRRPKAGLLRRFREGPAEA